MKALSCVVVIQVQTCASTAEEAAPPPPVVFNRQLEVGEGNSDEGGHNKEDDEHNEEDAVDGVHLVAPHAGKDVVPALAQHSGKSAAHDELSVH